MESSIEAKVSSLGSANEDMPGEIEARLAEISAALKMNSDSKLTREMPLGMACPIDPAERELCEGCQ
jgi:hypothetical protein